MLLSIAFDFTEALGDAGGDLANILAVWQEQFGVSVLRQAEGAIQVELGRADSLEALQGLQALLGGSGIGMTALFHNESIDKVAL